MTRSLPARPTSAMSTTSTTSTRSPGPPTSSALRGLAWLLPVLLTVAAAEVGAHVAIRARIPRAEHYAAATDFIAERIGADEAVSAAPAYIDPLVRARLGAQIGLRDAGRSDLAAHRGLWAISLHGALPADAPPSPPDLTHDFGPLSVRHWALPAPTVRFDFVQQLPRAEVTSRKRGAQRPCPLQHASPARGGGLGAGVVPPTSRFTCDGGHFVGAVVVEDLSLQPRYCVWQPPTGREPLTVRFSDVPLGDRLVVYGGLYYEHERMRKGAPVDLRVRIDGEPSGHMHHRDGDGWQRLELPTGGGRGEVSFEVTSAGTKRRGFCWAASIRQDPSPPKADR